MGQPGDILRALERHEEVREKRELIARLIKTPGVRAHATPDGIEVTLAANSADSLLKRWLRRWGKVKPDLIIRWSTDQQIRFLMDMVEKSK
jgi:hypothetical protein